MLAGELARRGYSQRLVVRRGSKMTATASGIEGLEVVEVASNLFAAGAAIRGCRVAHSHEGRTTYSGLYGKLFFDIPYVITRRVVAPQSRSFFRTMVYRRASEVAAVSDAARETLQVRHPDISVSIVPDAVTGFVVNEDEVRRISSKYVGKKVIGHVGALDHSHKGQLTIIEAARIAREQHPDWQFVLCGEGRDEGLFRREIGDLGNIDLVGWVDNVGDYLAAFDVFVYPSLHEALGSVLLDAMQFGLPIVATSVGGIPGIVRDGVNGLLISPEQPQEIVNGVDVLLSDPQRLAALQKVNRETAARYSASAMADRYVDLYNLDG